MAYFQSPVDPLFYAHHAFVDALQTIYVKCQLQSATKTLTSKMKGSDSRFWTNCARRTKGTFSNKDEVYMAVQNFSGQWVHVRKDPNNLLYPFFKNLPTKFSDLVDAKDLGAYSYSYNLTGAMKNMFTNCKDSKSLASAFLAEEDEPRDAQSSTFTTQNGSTVTDTSVETKARRWAIAIYESARLNGYTEEAAEDQMEMITCMHKHECLGEAQDYTSLFRKNFNVQGHPRCFTLIKALKSGDKVIGVPHWRKITSRFIPCPNKPSTTSPQTKKKKKTNTTTTTTTSLSISTTHIE